MVQNLGRDLGKLPSIERSLLVIAGSVGTAAIHRRDEDVASWAERSGGSSYAPFGRVLGDAWTQSAAALGTYAVGRISTRPAITHVGSDLIRAQLLNGVLTTSVKAAVDRPRPGGGGRAFPSGHASATFTSAAVLQGHYGWKVGVPAYAVASLVGWTRVRDRSHWLSDVFFGGTVGTIAGWTVTSGHRSKPTWTIVPSATKGGAALYVVKRH